MKPLKQAKIRLKSSQNRLTFTVLAVAAVIFLVLCLVCRTPESDTAPEGDYAEYETGRVIKIMNDTTFRDPVSDNAYRGEQTLVVEVTSGQYEGEQLLVDNAVGPLFGVPVKVGDSIVMIISTYENGDVRATVHEYNRETALVIVILLFMLATVLVGGKTGAKSLLGLIITVICIFRILIPLLMKGL
ncbi:MAG: hypothetical protein HUJ66_08225, partial [Oscillospiraceae bacterium]|nr:hypothetical protein [Oscillospiraceae bacterium]